MSPFFLNACLYGDKSKKRRLFGVSFFGSFQINRNEKNFGPIFVKTHRHFVETTYLNFIILIGIYVK